MTVQDSLSAEITTMFSFFLSLFINLKVLSLSPYTLLDIIFVTDLKYSWKFSFEPALIKGSNFDDKASNSSNIKLTIEEKPTKFPETEIVRNRNRQISATKREEQKLNICKQVF